MALIGVDGGGSKVVVRITQDDGSTLCEHTHSACANHQMVGASQAAKAIYDAVLAAMNQAGIIESDIHAVCLGLAGADYEWDRTLLREALDEVHRFPVEPQIVCDTILGLRLAVKDLVGVVLVCGSGTNHFGRNSLGQEYQVGGFGYLFGDYGGGYQLSVEVARAVFRGAEGRAPETELTELMLTHEGYPHVRSLKEAWLRENRQAPPLDLAPLLFMAAAKGDAVAMAILRQAGAELGLAARAVIRRLRFAVSPIPIVGIGAIIQYGRGLLLEALEKEVRTEFTDVQFVIPSVKPVEGAVLLALDNSSK